MQLNILYVHINIYNVPFTLTHTCYVSNTKHVHAMLVSNQNQMTESGTIQTTFEGSINTQSSPSPWAKDHAEGYELL